MKLFDRIFEKTLEASTRFLTLKSDLVSLAENVNQLARALVGVTQAVHSHHQAIGELYSVQAQILNVIKGGVVDARFEPEKKKEPAPKPN